MNKTARRLTRILSMLPWVIAKWAQTLDGRIATRTGESQFISSVSSRRLVHRERGRVCAILTGIGTVLADDPRLTARGVRVRRRARRIVIEGMCEGAVEATDEVILRAGSVVRGQIEARILSVDDGARFLGSRHRHETPPGPRILAGENHGPGRA